MSTLFSVTTILGVLDRYHGAPQANLKRASELGQKVHGHCLGHLKGLYLPVPPEVRPFFDAFREWADFAIEKTVAVEVELKDLGLNLIGHADLVARLKGYKGEAIIDLKRTAAPPDWIVGMQLAAYEYLWSKERGGKPRLRFALHSTANHKIHLYPYTRTDDLLRFLEARNLYVYCHNMKGVIYGASSKKDG